MDDKDEAANHVANLIRMKKGIVGPRHHRRAHGRRGGGDNNGVAWLIANQRPLIQAAYALNEGGGGMAQGGKRVANTVQASEKVYLSFTLEATNPGGHSSLPVAKNAIYELLQALLAIQRHEFPVMLNEVTRAYFTRTAEIVGGPMGEAMRKVLANPQDAAALAVLAAEPNYNARLRTTCVATQLQGGHAENALPQRARATVNCRILPGHDPADVQRTLTGLAQPAGVSVTPVQPPQPSPPCRSPRKSWRRSSGSTEAMWPG
jgi:acetylornithine deacetylase/succinyl-diaminopimelate desuccinylase-like protein